MTRAGPAVNRAAAILAATAGLFIVLNLALVLVDAVGGGPQGPASSSYAVGPNGLAAYARLLQRSGHRIRRLRTPLGIEPPSATATIVVLDATSLDLSDTTALSAAVVSGARLVVGGRTAGPWIQALVAGAPTPTDVGPLACAPSVAAPETEGVRQVESDGRAGWGDPGATLPILGCGTNILATVASPGEGRIVFLADAAPLTNRLLAVRDNAAFGIDIAGAPSRTIDFVEYVHGFKAPRGLAALPLRWKVALAALVVAAALWALARSSRPGPPPASAEDGMPGRAEHVESVARLMRGPRRAGAIRAAARQAVAGAAGIPVDAPDDEIRKAAERLGVPPPEAAAIVGTGSSDADVTLAGRALARFAPPGRVGG